MHLGLLKNALNKIFIVATRAKMLHRCINIDIIFQVHLMRSCSNDYSLVTERAYGNIYIFVFELLGRDQLCNDSISVTEYSDL